MSRNIEQKTARLYEDIHPYVDLDYAIDNYLSTIRLDESYFKGKDILDCGFGGTGWAVELFARAGAAQVSGVDINAGWAQKITERVTKRHPDSKVDLIHASVLDLPYPDDRFDYVHSHGVLHHTVDWKKGVAEMCRVVRPGGTVFLMLYGKFAPVGACIHGCYRLFGKIVPYNWSNKLVQKTGFFRHSEVSFLDAAYVPIEEHLSRQEIEDELRRNGMEDIRFYESAKWAKKKFYSSPLMFGAKIQNNVLAVKSGNKDQ